MIGDYSDYVRSFIRIKDPHIARCIKHGLTEEETSYMLDPKAVYGDDFPGETFRVLKENEIRKYSEYRTQRLVLHYYRAWRGGAIDEFDRWLHSEGHERLTDRRYSEAVPLGRGLTNQ